VFIKLWLLLWAEVLRAADAASGHWALYDLRFVGEEIALLYLMAVMLSWSRAASTSGVALYTPPSLKVHEVASIAQETRFVLAQSTVFDGAVDGPVEASLIPVSRMVDAARS